MSSDEQAHELSPYEHSKQQEPPKDLTVVGCTDNQEAPECPEAKANIISSWYYHWLTPFVWQAYQKPLSTEDLYRLADDKIALKMADQFEHLWNELDSDPASVHTEIKYTIDSKTGMREKHSMKSVTTKNLRTYRVLWRMFGWRFASIGVFHLLQAAANIASPIMISYLIGFVTQTQQAFASNTQPPPLWLGAVYSLVLFALQLIASATLGRYFYHSSTFGMKIRSCLAAVCYRKMMRLSAMSRQEYSGGRVMNMISSDLTRIESTIIQGHYIWSGPLQIVVILSILITYIGVVALAGFGLLIIMIPFQAVIFIRLGKLRQATASTTDSRIKSTSEYLQGIRIIKLFGWENSFLDRLMDFRSSEVEKIRRVNVLTSIVMGIATSFPTLASVISFIAYAAQNALNPVTIFAALAYFNMMRAPLIILPSIIRFFVESKVALMRLDEYLHAAEFGKRSVDQHSNDNTTSADDVIAIEMENCDFIYELPPTKSAEEKQKKDVKRKSLEDAGSKSGDKVSAAEALAESKTKDKSDGGDTENSMPKNESIFRLTHLNLKIKKGQLVGVIGPVGSGKTTLLNSILGEAKLVSGNFNIHGKAGYTLQTPWIQNGTLRKNILFGNTYDEQRYNDVIEASALSKDLKWLPGGSDTLLGEKGVQISGGQKARVSLARLMYCSPDIALLDDPLSAVDVHVGKHLFQKCIKGLLKDKTVILVTHHLSYIRQCDYVVVMNEGTVQEQGTFEELMEHKGECYRLISSFAGNEEESDSSAANYTDKTEPEDHVTKVSKALNMLEEERVVGSVSRDVYKEYLKAATGPLLFSSILFLVVIAQVSRVGNDLWLAAWSSDYFSDLNDSAYSGIYFLWGISQGFTAAALGVVLSFAFARASVILHKGALVGVFAAPMKFFDSTPLGRIVNRFSRDTDTMDASLPSAMQMFISICASLISTLILMVVVLPYLLIAVVPLLIVYYFMQKLYVRTSRELKRLESISRSPIYSHFSESLTGLSSIRAYCKQRLFIGELERMIDTNNQAAYLQIITQRWLSTRLDIIGSTICFLTALIGVLTSESFPAAIYGLALTYSLQVTLSLNFTVRQAVDVEVNANSIERLYHYSKNLEHEADKIVETNRPPSDWPQAGKIETRDLVIRYNEQSDAVIKGLSVVIPPKTKIGIVGRTGKSVILFGYSLSDRLQKGAGKSTIVSALFRLMEPSSGSILIDDVDITTIGLHDLRTHLAIIPQDPVLFSGTVRSNLDPFNEYEDPFIWEVLAGVNMKDAIAKLPEVLESKVEPAGENFSAGQKQLLCLARAMLRRPRILIMDEATASVDMESDQLIQTSIRRDFQQSTVITIAHRINTVIDYDRILVLDQGRLVEFDAPHVLLQKEDGIFRDMIEKTGPTNAAILKNLARTKYEGNQVGVDTLMRSSKNDISKKDV